MATLTIRNVDQETQKRLRIRAAHNGRSMEAELRLIIKDAVSAERTLKQTDSGEPNFAEAIWRMFEPFGGVDDLVPHPRSMVGEPPDLPE